MKNLNLEAVKTYLKTYELKNELSGVYVFYSDRTIQVEFVENNNRGMDKISQRAILNILDRLPDYALTNVVDLSNGNMKLSNDLILTELNYNLDFDFEDMDLKDELKMKAYDLVRKFEQFDNLYFKKVELKKDFAERYILKDMNTIESEINLLKHSGSKCTIIKFKKGENNER